MVCIHHDVDFIVALFWKSNKFQLFYAHGHIFTHVPALKKKKQPNVFRVTVT